MLEMVRGVGILRHQSDDRGRTVTKAALAEADAACVGVVGAENSRADGHCAGSAGYRGRFDLSAPAGCRAGWIPKRQRRLLPSERGRDGFLRIDHVVVKVILHHTAVSSAQCLNAPRTPRHFETYVLMKSIRNKNARRKAEFG